MPTTTRLGLPQSQSVDQKPIEAGAAVAFTVETKDKLVRFFDPLTIRVVLRNNSPSPISLNPRSLRLIPESWKGVSTGGSWMEGEGMSLATEKNHAGRIELAVGGSVSLMALEEDSSFESLGRVRVAYRLKSTDSETQQFMPASSAELSFDVPPTDLIAGVWTAQTESARDRIQPGFNEFLRFREAAQKDDDREFSKKILQGKYAAKTLFYMAGYALPFLDRALKDKDPFIREQAVLTYSHAARAIDQLDSFLDALGRDGPRPKWAFALMRNHNRDRADWRLFAMAALKDAAPSVRIAGVGVLTKSHWDQYNFDALEAPISYPSPWLRAFDNLRADRGSLARGVGVFKAETIENEDPELNGFVLVRALIKDPDAGVRAAVQNYLANFAGENAGANAVAVSLVDHDRTVRERALSALLRSPQPPPLETIKRAFGHTTGPTAVGLIPLLFEQENSSLPATLVEGFAARSVEERLAIMTVIAGHADASVLELVKLGLNDRAPAVQRAALMRLLSFPVATATPLIDTYSRHAAPDLRLLAQAAREELDTGRLWPFLNGVVTAHISGEECVFPSLNGTMPIVSPNGQWIAYVETGWGRPGGSGGFGRSNLISISHVVRTNGEGDRVVSDMFLSGWLADSNHVATARDGFVSISDLDGNATAEFGSELPEPYRLNNARSQNWQTGNLRDQFGDQMPHQKYLSGPDDGVQGGGENAACSPDGEWLGPLQGSIEAFLLATDGRKIKLYLPAYVPGWSQAIWSPNDRHVLVTGAIDGQWLVIDLQTRGAHRIQNLDSTVQEGSWDYRSRWNPWAKDGSRLAFLRKGQVWVSGPTGEDAKQLTFDSTRKAFPTFSRDSRSIAYLTWQPDNRLHYTRLGPTDLWVADIGTTLATRVTASATGRINSFDWLDDHTLIFDRLEQEHGKSLRWSPHSSLRRLSLLTR